MAIMKTRMVLCLLLISVSIISGCSIQKSIVEDASEADSSNIDNNDVRKTQNNSMPENSTQTIEEEEDNNTMQIKIGENTLTATLVDNSSTKALKELLSKGSLSIQMRDYGNMEKVGMIGESLPRNDEQITTEAGDIILYQGNSLVLYYDTNSWNFTRIGKVDNMTQEELKKVLGTGDVIVTLSLE